MAGKSCNDLEEAETSSLTVKNGCSEVGGYDCDFVEPPADDLLCKICHYPARDPQQTNTCCGQTFCAMCLGKYMDSKILDNKQCPYCKTVPFTFVPDARSKRYVGGLKVFCLHKLLGCTWTGELRSLEEHLVKDIDNKRGCPFTELQCSNGCGVVMQRRLVEGHLKSECELREVKCEYCNTTGSYQWINSSHHEECPKYPVECPNHCEVGHVRREEISGHLEECPLAIVACPYAAVGCESVVRRKEEMEHVMGSVGQHMEYNKNFVLANQNRVNVEMENVRQDLQVTKDKLITKEQELEDVKRDLVTREQTMVSINKDLQDTKDKLEQSQSQLKTTITEKGRELDEVRKNAEESIKALQVIHGAFQKRLDVKEQEIENVKQNLQTKEQELENVKRDLQATRDRLDTKMEQVMIEMNKQSQEMQSQLKTTTAEKGRELDEVRKNAEENNKSLRKMIQLKDKLEGTEQSLQHQLKVNTQLQLQVETISNSTWPLQLNYLGISGNEVIVFFLECIIFSSVMMSM